MLFIITNSVVFWLQHFNFTLCDYIVCITGLHHNEIVLSDKSHGKSLYYFDLVSFIPRLLLTRIHDRMYERFVPGRPKIFTTVRHMESNLSATVLQPIRFSQHLLWLARRDD